MFPSLAAQCVIAAILGTVAMTLSSATEAALSRRESSDAPGKAVSRVWQLFGGSPLEGAPLQIASTWGHWLYGAAWGIALWILVDPQYAALDLWVAGLVFLAIVWAAAQAVTPTLAGMKPSLFSGLKPTLIELLHHVVYAAGATLSLALLWEIAGDMP